MTGNRLPQVVSGITPLDEALDGTPIRKKRTPAKPKDPPAIGTAFACHCGQRFDDLREAWIHVRAEYADLRQVLANLRRSNGNRLVAECGTLAGYSRHIKGNESVCGSCQDVRRVYAREYARARRADPAIRERQRANQHKYKVKKSSDPEYRKRMAANERARRARMKSDPEYRDRRLVQERARRRRAREKAADAAATCKPRRDLE